jgi:hypothetical protein
VGNHSTSFSVGVGGGLGKAVGLVVYGVENRRFGLGHAKE